MSLTLPRVGDTVEVRARRHVVLACRPSIGKGETWLRLAGLDDDDAGTERELLWELEPDARLLASAGWDALGAKGVDAPERFEAYLNALRWNAVAAADPERFLSPHRAGIEVKSYQLAPLRKALAQPRVALLVADDVGLGKTIEAGLIARELLMRGRLRHVVVAAPASVVHQWRGELLERFGLDATVMDRAYVDSVRRRFGFTANPWATAPHFVVSHALLRDEAYALPLRDWLDNMGQGGKMLILDEAHHAAPSSGFAYAVDSQLTRAVRSLSSRFEHRLFLSATPHNGHSNSFTSLLEMLDPTRFVRGVGVSAPEVATVMVRRLKRELAPHGFGFTKRVVEAFELAGLPEDAPELVVHQALNRYLALRAARLAQGSKGVQRAGRLASIGLVKRLLSGLPAFARTLRVHAEGARAALAKAQQLGVQLALPSLAWRAPGADDAEAQWDEEQLDREETAALKLVAEASGQAGGAELAALAELESLCEGLAQRPCAKTRHLAEWVVAQQTAKGAWGNRRLLVFTEYTDTMRALQRQLGQLLEAAGVDSEDRIETLHGGTGEDRRRELVRCFNAPAEAEPLRVLIATDAAREGLNLQAACADLIHFDLPWNPARLEQRNGRLDRLLQPSPEVRVHYYVYAQRPEDQVLKALVRKTESIQAELGSMGEVLERELEHGLAEGAGAEALGALVQGIEAAGDAEAQAEALAELGQASQGALAEELAQLRVLLDRSSEAQGLDEGRFVRALNVALALQKAPPLKALGVTSGGQEGHRYEVPPLDQLVNLSWQGTMDALRPPKPQAQPDWQWRKEQAIRPVVFRDTGHLGGGVAHLHLEHRLTKRLLASFTAGQSRERALAQAVAVLVPSGGPQVALVGRLVLHGLGGERLHDELLAVAMPWVPAGLKAPDEAQPWGPEAWEVLWQALASGQSPREAEVQARLATRTRDVAALQAAWEGLRELREALAREHLALRGDSEAKALAGQLDALRTALQRQLQERRAPKRMAQWERERQRQAQRGQLAFGEVLDTLRGKTEAELARQEKLERAQREQDEKHWARRIEELAKEKSEAPELLRQAYAVGLARIEPVGLVHLCPVGG